MADTKIPSVAPGRRRQMEIYVPGASGAKPRAPVSPAALELAAQRAMTREAAAYIIGGAGSEQTMRNNRAAFDRVNLAPRAARRLHARPLRYAV